jgi:hypothetical protein
MAIDIAPEWKERISRLLPDLQEGVSFEYTSPVDPNYNCLAWALGHSFSAFENSKGAFWPWKNIPDDTAHGWAQVCEIQGFRPATSSEFVTGYEKIAILEDEQGELHACRQNQAGRWKSKLGDLGPDIDHDGLSALETAYGKAVIILQRRRPDWDVSEPQSRP